jgi:hypothetical protein
MVVDGWEQIKFQKRDLGICGCQIPKEGYVVFVLNVEFDTE